MFGNAKTSGGGVAEWRSASRQIPSLYPFESKWFDSSAGRTHYIEEGSGTPILLCHGNPTWIGVVSPSLLSVHRCRTGRASDRAPQTPRPRPQRASGTDSVLALRRIDSLGAARVQPERLAGTLTMRSTT